MSKIFKFVPLLLFIGLALAGCTAPKPPANNTTISTGGFPVEKIEDLAKALTAAGARVYGSEFCSACQYQKQMFGEAWRFVTYIKCDISATSGAQNSACRAAEITLYPTWEFAQANQLQIFPSSGAATGDRLQGVQSLETLASKIGFLS
ncbi:hypothetical protein JXA59_01190 [Patescibacteria group bacterium]|nr:hypothetical protein [Patescibacteria group bacterium]